MGVCVCVFITMTFWTLHELESLTPHIIKIINLIVHGGFMAYSVRVLYRYAVSELENEKEREKESKKKKERE